jgi:hypothetical protein
MFDEKQGGSGSAGESAVGVDNHGFYYNKEEGTHIIMCVQAGDGWRTLNEREQNIGGVVLLRRRRVPIGA